jgi:hypothetical protein
MNLSGGVIVYAIEPSPADCDSRARLVSTRLPRCASGEETQFFPISKNVPTNCMTLALRTEFEFRDFLRKIPSSTGRDLCQSSETNDTVDVKLAQFGAYSEVLAKPQSDTALERELMANGQ